MKALLVVLLTALLSLLSCAPAPAQERSFTLLSANVGNTLLACGDYAYKLCHIDVEERLAENIQALSPDIVALQEVVGRHQCTTLDDEQPGFTCHDEHTAAELSQARRLVGPDYAVACAERHGYECVAVKMSFASVVGCDEDGDCEPAMTAPLVEGCDPGFSLSAVDVRLPTGSAFRLVNAHPQSGFDAACRAGQLEQLFGPVAGQGATLIAGDLNLDPFQDNDESVDVWDEHVGEGRRFRYHSGPAEHRPPYVTSVNPLSTGVLDHVVSDFAEGSCVTLGEAPDTERLDGGEGTDHRALSCTLTL